MSHERTSQITKSLFVEYTEARAGAGADTSASGHSLDGARAGLNLGVTTLPLKPVRGPCPK
jgi:hypothetical protein